MTAKPQSSGWPLITPEPSQNAFPSGPSRSNFCEPPETAAATPTITPATTSVVSSGEEALDTVRREDPCLLVLDVGLRGLSGYEVCRRLRDELGNRLPIVFVSGVRTESFDRAAGLLMGADDYLVKPVAPDEFLAERRRWRLLTARGSCGSISLGNVRRLAGPSLSSNPGQGSRSQTLTILSTIAGPRVMPALLETAGRTTA